MAKCGASDECGAIAQLGERLHGMQEVGGSIPPGSTIYETGRIASGFFIFRIKRHMQPQLFHGCEGYRFSDTAAIINMISK